MAISLLVEHLRWISLSRLLGITPLRPITYIEYSNDPQLFTNSMISATLPVIKVESEMESIAITGIKRIHVQITHKHVQVTYMYMYAKFGIFHCSGIQSSLRTKDTLGTGLLSFALRLSLSRRFMIFQSILIA